MLVPEGRVVISGLNPASLWGFSDGAPICCGAWALANPYLPDRGEFIGYWRLRDWLRLLNFEVESSRFGCYRPRFVQTDGWSGFPGWTALARAGGRFWGCLFHRRRQAGAWRCELLSRAGNLPFHSANNPVSIANYHQPKLGNKGKLLNHIEIHTDGACKATPDRAAGVCC